MLSQRARRPDDVGASCMTPQTATEPQAKSPARLARVLSRARAIHPVWGLNVALLTTAAALYIGPVHGLRRVRRGLPGQG